MHRTQILLEDHQYKRLLQESRRRGISYFDGFRGARPILPHKHRRSVHPAKPFLPSPLLSHSVLKPILFRLRQREDPRLIPQADLAKYPQDRL
jgi:hypothetical protein